MDTNQHLHAFGSIDIDHRHSNARGAFAPAGRLRDSHGRAITDLRISVTDRCNYKCVYCRTGNEGAQFTELSPTRKWAATIFVRSKSFVTVSYPALHRPSP